MSDLYHPLLHERLDERLFFFRATISPTYEREDIVLALRTVFNDEGIGSYAVYEVNGGYDLFIRAWIPPHINGRTLQDLFNASLAPKLRVTFFDPFRVDEQVYHWVWGDTGRAPDVHRTIRSLGRTAEGLLTELSRMSQEKRREKGLAAPLVQQNGIKVFAMLSAQIPTDGSIQGDVQQRLLGIVDRLRERGLLELSLYAGQGSGAYLLTAKVRPDNFFDDVRSLIDLLNQAPLQGTANVRTFTYFSLRAEMLCFSERLISADHDGFSAGGGDVAPSESERLLAGGETQHVEVKGSAFADVGAALHQGGTHRASHEQSIFAKGIARTLVAFLNSSAEADLIVGAIEAERFKVDRLDEHAVDLVESSPHVGEYVVIGNAFDVRKDLSAAVPPEAHHLTTSDLDLLQRRISSSLEKWIEPDPSAHINFYHEPVRDRSVFRLHVKPPIRGRNYGTPLWFYLIDADNGTRRFYVRRMAESLELSGVRLDSYKQQILLSPSASDEISQPDDTSGERDDDR